MFPTSVLVALIEAAEPAIKEVVVSLLQALNHKDAAATRAATEAALRLSFEVRQDIQDAGHKDESH